VLIAAVALLPVLVFLLVLVLADSFKLVPSRTLAMALGAGALAALVAGWWHEWIFQVTGLGVGPMSRYVAPVTEETLKAVFLMYLFWRRQVGFLVDAAIIGFAVGAGFAVVENVEYLRALSGGSPWLWVVRGFGTAMVHAANTAIVAIAARALLDRSPRHVVAALWPGWVAAVVLHSTFNHVEVSALASAALGLIVLPAIVLVVFSRSEQATRAWMGEGLDLDVELLRLVTSSHFGTTRLGRYLTELRSRFPGPVVADMFCLLRLDLELSIRAKGMLMAREAGLDVPADEALRAQLAERVYLKTSIGRTGMIALRPLQVTGSRDEWQQTLLKR